MNWLNYNHLLYFWTVAREGTIAAAAKQLYVTQSTISTQIRVLETRLGAKLFRRVGRNLALTETGQLVYRYAGEIFTLGAEMIDSLRDGPSSRLTRLHVGAQDTLPKLVVSRLLAPVFLLPQPIKVVFHEGTPVQLLPRLSTQEVDLVFSDAPMDPQIKVRAFNHVLGECGIGLYAAPEIARRLREGFPDSLSKVPALLPASSAAMRVSLDRWFHTVKVRPTVVVESEDFELMVMLGQQGQGFFPAHDLAVPQAAPGSKVELIGRLDGCTERFYAISIERQIKHPAVVAITKAARHGFSRGF